MAKIYENYPLSTVLTVILLFLLVYTAGAFVMFTLHWVTGVLFIIFILVLEFSIYKEACVGCYYYGKRCGFGRGLIAPMFFKKGSAKAFEKDFTWKDFIPQTILVAVPVLVGVALMVSRGFMIPILIAIIYPVFNWFVVNPILFGKLTCPHCKQGTICCPALKFFGTK